MLHPRITWEAVKKQGAQVDGVIELTGGSDAW